jgi:hypothetical protein
MRLRYDEESGIFTIYHGKKLIISWDPGSGFDFEFAQVLIEHFWDDSHSFQFVQDYLVGDPVKFREQETCPAKAVFSKFSFQIDAQTPVYDRFCFNVDANTCTAPAYSRIPSALSEDGAEYMPLNAVQALHEAASEAISLQRNKKFSPALKHHRANLRLA